MLLLQHLRITLFTVTLVTVMCQCVMMKEFNDSVIINCTLKSESKEQQLKLENLIDEKTRLITIDVNVKWSQKSPNGTYPDHMTWFLTMDDSGKRLLYLKEQFVVMSVGTLSYGIAEMQLSLVQTPDDCLGNMSASGAETHLIYSLLTLPETPAVFDEYGINLLSLCTGSIYSDGTCCNVEFSTKTAKCKRLLVDNWTSHFSLINFFLTICVLSQIISLIPTSIFDDSEKHTFHILGDISKLKVKVCKDFAHRNSFKEMKGFKHCKLLIKVCEVIEEKINSEGSNFQQQDLSCSFKVQSVERKNSDLVPEFYPSMNVMQSLLILLKESFRRCINALDIQNNSICSKLWKVFIDIVASFLCTSPIILRSCYIAFYLENLNFEFFLNIIFIFCLTFWNILATEQSKKVFNSCIKDAQSYTLSDNMKDIATHVWLHLEMCPKFCKCVMIILVFILVTLSALLSRLWLFICLVFFRCKRFGTNWDIIIPICVCLGLISIDCFILFFMECLAYILIGIFLNYELILDKILLVTMVTTYITNSFTVIHRKMHCFNVKVTKLVGQINEEVTENGDIGIEMNDRQENNGTAMQVQLNNPTEKVVKIVARSENMSFLSVPGLFIFRSFENSENLPLLHIPKQFIDTLASMKSIFTPEPSHVLFFRAFLESSVFCFALYALFLVLRGFMKAYSVSTTINTIVSVGSSAVLIMLNKLLFKAAKPTFDENDMHLKELIKTQIHDFKESWEDISFSPCFSENDYQSINSSVSSDSDFDLVAEVFSDNDTLKVKSIFCKEMEDFDLLIEKSPFLYYLSKDLDENL